MQLCMTRAANLRHRARELRDMAALCRRRGTALSLILDRTKMRGHATELETQAARLDALVDDLERD